MEWDPQIVEYEDDGDGNYEADVDWYTGDCDDELDDTAYTAGTPTDDPELLEQFDGKLEGADASASQVFASASRSFQEARFWLVSRVPEAIFLLLVLVLLMAWLSHPLIENLQRLVAKARRVGGKENPFLRKVENRQTWVHLAFLPKTHNTRVESRPPMSKKRPTEAGATRGGPHHAPRLRPDQCMLCRQVGHRASECPNKGKPTALSLGKRAFGTYALGCAVFDSPVLWCHCRRNRTRSRRGGH